MRPHLRKSAGKWPEAPRRPRRPLGGPLRWLTHGIGAFLVSVVFVCALFAGFLYLRLSEGPVSLGPISDVIVERLNARQGDRRFEVSDVVLALGREGRSSGLRLRDVAVLDGGGATIARAPEIGVRFRAWDAMRGDLAPTRIRLDHTEATLRRNADGGFSFKFAEPAGDSGASFFELLRSAERDEGALRKLRRVEARDVTLTYDDRASGRSWTADGVDIAVWRIGDALYGSLSVRADLGAGRAINLVVTGDRPLQTGETSVTASFSGAEGRDLGAQIPELAWLNGVRAPISGTLSLTLADDGGVRALDGRLEVGAGEAVSADGAATEIRRAAATLDYDAAKDRFEITEAKVDAAALSAEAEGTADILRDAEGGIAGLVLQTRIRDAAFDPPGVFAAPLAFDAGKMTARVRFDPLKIELGEARLETGGAHFTADGVFAREEGGWTTDLNFGARTLPATQLVNYWPVGAAPDARDWTAQYIRAGVIETVAGFARLGGGAPQFALNFAHRGVEAEVVRDMTPITGAAGTGHLDMERFTITVDDGDVVLGENRVIAMDGSSFTIPDLRVKPAPAVADLRAAGAIRDILDFIDQEPLRLTRKFEGDLSGIAGAAELAADLRLPLIRHITPGIVEVEAAATLRDVRYPLRFGGLAATAPELALTATNRRLEVTGPTAVGGLSGALTWREQLGAAAEEEDGPRTLITLDTRLDDAALKRLGLAALTIREGYAPTTLTLSADRGTPLAIALRSDLGPARMAAPGLGLEKGEGPGSISARGTLRDGIAIDALTATAPDFTVEGSARLGPDLALRAADLSRLEVGGHTQLTLALRREGEARVLDVKGPKLDLRWLAAMDSGGAETPPTRAALAVDRLRLTDDLVLRAATGDAATSGGATEANLRGRVNGGAEARLAYSSAADGAGKVRIDAGDAGAFLRDLGYFDNGYGGALALEANLGPGGVSRVDGELAIDGIVVRRAPALARMLSIASLIGLFDALQSGGITFSEVRAPFRVRDGVITLDEALATGPSMGLKMDGSYATGPDRIDMSGVLTPAYALNAVLANAPLIGEALGGEGEGLFAFTFSVRGSKDAPEVNVNPLSVLTPGALRGIFSGGGGGASSTTTTRPEAPSLKDQRVDR